MMLTRRRFWVFWCVMICLGGPSWAGAQEASDAGVAAAAGDKKNAASAIEQIASDIIAGAKSQENGEGLDLSSPLSILLILTVLSIAPAILILCTSFTRIVIVLALLRQALGTQQLPPSQVVVGLAMFMTFLVMAPTFSRINDHAIAPLQANEITEDIALARSKAALRDFMITQIQYAGNESDIYMILNYRGVDTSRDANLTWDDVDMVTLIPSFILSELKVAFLMGFQLYLPFLVVDMVISSVLISMGMLMLPPVLISLPFKLLLFVLVDGWMLVAGNILHSFAPVVIPAVGGG